MKPIFVIFMMLVLCSTFISCKIVKFADTPKNSSNKKILRFESESGSEEQLVNGKICSDDDQCPDDQLCSDKNFCIGESKPIIQNS